MIKLVHVVPPLPHRSRKISHLTERCLGTLIEDVEEILFMEDKEHGDDPKTTTSQC